MHADSRMDPPRRSAAHRSRERLLSSARPGSVSRASAAATLAIDEVRRTHRFMLISGALAVIGGIATFLFDGDRSLQVAFLLGIVGLIVGYSGLWWHTRDGRNYTPGKAVYVITLCNLAGIAACLYFGLFSPAPMILLLPIAFIGRSASGGAAWGAYGLAAGSMAVPMLLVAVGGLEDPGLVRADELGRLEQLLYAGLVQAVFLAAMANARASRRATELALAGMERAVHQMNEARQAAERAEVQLEELVEHIDAHDEGGKAGPLTGRALGDWSLGGLLGRGAMGDVYSAVRTADGLEGAVKVLNPVAASDPKAKTLMQREAALMRELRSPHVVRLLDLAFEPLPWIAMELLRGEDLAAILRRDEKLDPAALCSMLEQVATGLDTAAGVELLHRDLKPSNLFRAEHAGGTVWKVVDFGLAKVAGQDLSLTSGDVLGTPGYIAPEILRGEPVDRRADVFSLAVIAYRCLAGTRPFTGRGHALLLSTLEKQPLRPSAWGIDPAYDDVLRVGLAKDPRDRFDTATDFANALDAARAGEVPAWVRSRARALLGQQDWAVRA